MWILNPSLWKANILSKHRKVISLKLCIRGCFDLSLMNLVIHLYSWWNRNKFAFSDALDVPVKHPKSWCYMESHMKEGRKIWAVRAVSCTFLDYIVYLVFFIWIVWWKPLFLSFDHQNNISNASSNQVSEDHWEI